ncbi:MAG: L,D-transpeptidase family protein [Planctomycetota bacterium]
MKKAILGLAGLVLFACMMYILYPSIMRFLHLDQTSARPPSLTSQTPVDDKKKPELPPRTGHELSATVNTTPPEPPGKKDVPDAVAQFLSSAREAEDRGNVVAARNAYSGAYKAIVLGDLQDGGCDEIAADLRSLLDRLNRQIYYDRWNLFEGQQYYVFKQGDYLSTIAARFGVTDDFLASINGIPDKNRIRAGEKVKIVNGTFNVVIDLSDRKMYVLHGESYFCEYDVSVGMAGRETPADTYTVGGKEKRPSWTDPDTGIVYRPGDPDYPLGTRWISLVGDKVGRAGIGIHGQSGDAVSEIGDAVSRGCIRMHNRDVEELFSLMTTGKSRVLVRE